MKRLFSLLTIILNCLAISSSSAQAQENGTEAARYQVQPGDTMSAISVRFDIPLQDLIEENDLVDPNRLDAGAVLSLPGMDWISGLLVRKEMAFGESLQSLSIKYRTTTATMARLNRISSREQLFVSVPILIPTERGEDLSMGRAIVGSGVSMLEMAIDSGTNPWSIAEANQLRGGWGAIPGQVLYLPGTNQPGPGGLPSLVGEVQISSAGFVQGKVVVFIISAVDEYNSLKAILINKEFRFFRDERGGAVAIMGIHAMTPPGFYMLTIEGEVDNETIFTFTQTVMVRSGGYRSEAFSVDPAFLDPEISNAESARIELLVAASTELKRWEGYFLIPSPFGDTINSFFGTRRSYNGSDYDFFHGGVDFGGGLGVQVFAPAAGIVVFAEAVEIRGNATIIDHGWGVYTGYFHQSEILVKVGDNVQPGQVIGIVGSTGRSTGAHLHWEMWVSGIQVDPLDWLTILIP